MGVDDFERQRPLCLRIALCQHKRHALLTDMAEVKLKSPELGQSKTATAPPSVLHWYTPIRQQMRRTMNDSERNSLQEIIDKAIEEMAREAGDSFDIDHMNLA